MARDEVAFAAALVSFFTLPVMMSFLEVWGERAGAIAVASMSASSRVLLSCPDILVCPDIS